MKNRTHLRSLVGQPIDRSNKQVDVTLQDTRSFLTKLDMGHRYPALDAPMSLMAEVLMQTFVHITLTALRSLPSVRRYNKVRLAHDNHHQRNRDAITPKAIKAQTQITADRPNVSQRCPWKLIACPR